MLTEPFKGLEYKSQEKSLLAFSSLVNSRNHRHPLLKILFSSALELAPRD